jgi:hypothetical protein
MLRLPSAIHITRNTPQSGSGTMKHRVDPSPAEKEDPVFCCGSSLAYGASCQQQQHKKQPNQTEHEIDLSPTFSSLTLLQHHSQSPQNYHVRYCSLEGPRSGARPTSQGRTLRLALGRIQRRLAQRGASPRLHVFGRDAARGIRPHCHWIRCRWIGLFQTGTCVCCVVLCCVGCFVRALLLLLLLL